MKLLLSSLAAAAVAMVASAAPTVIAPEVTRELPARFAMYLVTAEARVDGLRVGYQNRMSRLDINFNLVSTLPTVDAIFLGGRGRIAIDKTVHQRPDNPEFPLGWGDWNVSFERGVSDLRVATEEWQDTMASWDRPLIVSKFVQDSKNILRLLDADGVLQPNGLRVCGRFSDRYNFMWDDAPYLDCPVAEFRIVPL